MSRPRMNGGVTPSRVCTCAAGGAAGPDGPGGGGVALSGVLAQAAISAARETAAAVFMLDQPNVHIIRADIKGYADNPAYGHITFVNELSR